MTEQTASSDAPVKEPVAFESLELEIIEGPDKGARFTLHEGKNVIGRMPDVDIRLDANEVSRRHVGVTVGKDIAVEDLGSAVGTSLNGRLLISSEFLFDNDEITVGPYRLRIEIKRRESRVGIVAGLLLLTAAAAIFMIAMIFPESTYADRAAARAAKDESESESARWRDWESLLLPDTDVLAADNIEISRDSALEQYEFGTRLYQDRLGDLSNPYQALLHYKRTLAVLDELPDAEKRPAVSNRCVTRIVELRTMIKDECEKRIFAARKNAKLRWWRKAAGAARDVRRISPWPGSRYHRWASRQLERWRRLGKL